MNADDSDHIRELIAVHQRRLRKLEVQAAALGAHCPAPILVEIDETRANIARFEEQLEQRVIGSYLEGRKTARDFAYDLDAIEYKLNQVVVRETRVYRFFGLPIFSVSTVISRVLTLFLILIGLALLASVVGVVLQTAVVRDQRATIEAAERLQKTAQSALTAQATATNLAATTTAMAGATATADQIIAATSTASAQAVETARAVAFTATAAAITNTPTATTTLTSIIPASSTLTSTMTSTPSSTVTSTPSSTVTDIPPPTPEGINTPTRTARSSLTPTATDTPTRTARIPVP